MAASFRLCFITVTFSVCLLPMSVSAEEGVVVDGAGYTLHDAESIKGHNEQTLEKDPVCDSSKKPKITKVEPDEAKPGQTVTIKGEHFGTKDCFRGVVFSAAGPSKVTDKFMNDSTIEATVPETQPGMSFIDVITSGGSARSKAFLIQAK